MWLPRGLSANGTSINEYGMTKEYIRKKQGDQEVAVTVYFSKRVPFNIHTSAIKDSDSRNTSSRAPRRERIGPRERPAVGGA